MRRILASLARWLVHPTTLGAAYLLALAWFAAQRGRDADLALEGQSRAIVDAIHTSFAADVHRVTVAISAVAVAIGGVLGFVAAGLVWLRDKIRGRAPLAGARRVLLEVALIVLLQGLAEAYAMARAPQLFAADWYAKGGLPRTVQIVLTDVLGTRGVVTLGALVLAAVLVGPGAEWSAWPARARALTQALRTWARGRVMGVAAGAVVVALGTVAALGLGSVGRAKAAGSSRMNVLVLAADSLRADRIDPRTAPRLSRLANEAVRFDHAYVSLPRTFPSWVTLLTGRYPHHHGIRSMFPRWEDRAKDLDALPARLAKDGYRTAVVSDFAGDIFDRIDLGWTETHVPTFDFKQLIRQRALERETPLLPYLHSRVGRSLFPVLRELSDAADPRMLTADAIAALTAEPDRPFFLTVFYSTAHFPYAAPAPYYGRFTRPDYRGLYKYDKPVALEHGAPCDADDVAQIRALYDGAVSGIDEGMGAILDALARSGRANDTIVVVLADHGETLYESGRGAGHGDHLFGDEGTHIPLLVFDPRRAAKSGGKHVTQVVRDVDIAPTLYDLTGAARPSDLDGSSLAPALDGDPIPPRIAFAETGLWFTPEVDGVPANLRLPYPGISGLTEVDADHGDEVVLTRELRPMTIVAKHRMARDERYKLVYAPTRGGAKYFLYDTAADPGETHDVSASAPKELSRLEGELWRWMLSDPDMVERGGVLVPRDASVAPAEATEHTIRVDQAPSGATPTAASPGAEP